MKKFVILLASLGVVAAAAPATASAAPSRDYGHGYASADSFQRGWQSINARQARIKNRIAAGVRSGALNRREAARLNARFHELANLEARYRRSGGGLSVWERRDLDSRFDVLERAVRIQKHDAQTRRSGRHY
jgi:hypothetical protein